MLLLKKIAGSGLGSGYFPFAPGTFGSMTVLLILWPLIQTNIWFLPLLFGLLCSIITLWVSPALEESWGEDPPKLVMDEWAGMGITCTAFNWGVSAESALIAVAGGFILFRFFDIIKPLGISRLQDLPGGWGILADDLLAGLYGLICLKTLIFAWPKIEGLF